MKKTTKWRKVLSCAALVAVLGVGSVACSTQDGTSHHSTNSSKVSSTSTSQSTSKKTSTSIKISQTEAIAKFNKKFPNSKIKAIELQSNGTKYIYQIEGFDSEREHELTLNAETGAELHSHSETLDLDDHHQSSLNLAKVISRTEAGKIAEKRAKGTAIEWKLEIDDGQPIWEVTVKDGNHHHEVKINAETKRVLESEYDD